LICPHPDALTLEIYPHFFARISPTPYLDFRVALQNHTAADEFR
jgi:hypothetical protein